MKIKSIQKKRGILGLLFMALCIFQANLFSFEANVDNQGNLHIEITDPAGEHIRVYVVEENGHKYVKINDMWPFDPNGNSVHPENIKSIAITGGRGPDFIDLRDVKNNDFNQLNNLFDNSYASKRCDVFVDAGLGDDRVYGSDCNDNINGGFGNDILFGYDGHDNLYGQSGNDNCHGGDGNDFIDGDPPFRTISSEEDDILIGDDGDDRISDIQGNDYINGGNGNDNIFKLNGSADVLIDSAGVDTVSFEIDSTGLTFDLDLIDEWQVVNADTDSIKIGGIFEHLVGSPFDDVFFVDPDTFPRIVDGGDHINGDTLYFNAKGKEVMNDGFHLVVEGYDTVTYANFEVIIYENQSSVFLDETHSTIPLKFSLSQNFPNPFNAETTIGFAVKSSCHVTLKVFDVQGREIATLINAPCSRGSYRVKWNASFLASGIYFYHIFMADFQDVRKMVVLK